MINEIANYTLTISSEALIVVAVLVVSLRVYKKHKKK